MENNTFWYGIWKMIGITFATSMLGFSGCTMHENYLIREMVANGTDPLKASCSLSYQSSATMCNIVSGRAN